MPQIEVFAYLPEGCHGLLRVRVVLAGGRFAIVHKELATSVR